MAFLREINTDYAVLIGPKSSGIMVVSLLSFPVAFMALSIIMDMGLVVVMPIATAVPMSGINLIFIMLGTYLIDKADRRRFMIIGSIGYIMGLSMVAWAFYIGASPGF